MLTPRLTESVQVLRTAPTRVCAPGRCRYRRLNSWNANLGLGEAAASGLSVNPGGRQPAGLNISRWAAPRPDHVPAALRAILEPEATEHAMTGRSGKRAHQEAVVQGATQARLRSSGRCK